MDTEKIRNTLWEKYGDIIIDFMQMSEKEQNDYVQKAMKAAVEKSSKAESNVSKIPDDLALAGLCMEEELGWGFHAYIIGKATKYLPDRVPKAWGPYHAWEIYPNTPDEFTDEVCARYDKDMWIKWQNAVSATRLWKAAFPANYPAPVETQVSTWYIYLVSMGTKAVNAVIAQGWMRDNGYKTAFAEGPTLISAREATPEEVKFMVKD